jgi:hypothetical protein
LYAVGSRKGTTCPTRLRNKDSDLCYRHKKYVDRPRVIQKTVEIIPHNKADPIQVEQIPVVPLKKKFPVKKPVVKQDVWISEKPLVKKPKILKKSEKPVPAPVPVSAPIPIPKPVPQVVQLELTEKPKKVPKPKPLPQKKPEPEPQKVESRVESMPQKAPLPQKQWVLGEPPAQRYVSPIISRYMGINDW